MKRPQGIVIYNGPSQIDNKPIIVIITGTGRASKNTKTGKGCLQSWILRKDISPIKAFLKGQDFSVCGNCKHRIWGTCYVNVFIRGPQRIWEAYKRNLYPSLSIENLKYLLDSTLRIGSYGDPVAVPFEVWNSLLPYLKNYTSYTHQWRTCDSQWKKICMASVDSEEEARKAISMGWRTFRIRMKDEKFMKDEIGCPAARENGHKTTCTKCSMCCGKTSKTKKNIFILIHGTNWKVKKFKDIMELRKRHKKYSHILPNFLRKKERVKL